MFYALGLLDMAEVNTDIVTGMVAHEVLTILT